VRSGARLRSRPVKAGAQEERAATLERIATLSGREREVMDGLVAGEAKMAIGFNLGFSARTMEVYRANGVTRCRPRRYPKLSGWDGLPLVVATPNSLGRGAVNSSPDRSGGLASSAMVRDHVGRTWTGHGPGGLRQTRPLNFSLRCFSPFTGLIIKLAAPVSPSAARSPTQLPCALSLWLRLVG
jgi:hypothetical protein